MHTRRVGAFLIGAWLIGSLIVWFVTSQSLVNVDRILNSPPTTLSREFENMAPDVTRRILTYEAMQHNGHVSEAWEVMQLGLGAALLATSVLTAHRSRFLIGSAVVMTLMTAIMGLYLTPTINALGRSFDFLPAAAPPAVRESVLSYQTWHRVLEVLKTGLGFAIAARLLFDRYNWRDKLIPTASKPTRRRVRRTPSSSSGTRGTAGEEPAN
jgi:hypothetical protein